MSGRRDLDLDLDLVLGVYLQEGPAAAPDRAIDAALDLAAATPQRRRPLSSWRIPMSVTVRVALGAALLLVAAASGAIYLGGRPPTPIPSPSASPSPTPVVSDSPSLAPSTSASPAPAASPTDPAAALSLAAIDAVDAAVTAARQPSGLTTDDQSGLLRLTDSIRAPLEESGDVPEAAALYAPLQARVAGLVSKLTGASGDRLRAAVATLGGALTAKPFAPAGLAAGTYYATRFTPVFAIGVPAGWARSLEDAEVLVLRKGGLTLAFNHTATANTADALVKAFGTVAVTDLASPPAAVALGSSTGFAASLADAGGRTLWFTEGLQAYDANAGDTVRIWVIGIRGRPLTIDLSGPPPELGAALPEVDAMLGTLLAP